MMDMGISKKPARRNKTIFTRNFRAIYEKAPKKNSFRVIPPLLSWLILANDRYFFADIIIFRTPYSVNIPLATRQFLLF